MPRGKKICPECNTENGVRSFCCHSCGYEFHFWRKRKENLKWQRNLPVPKLGRVRNSALIAKKSLVLVL